MTTASSQPNSTLPHRYSVLLVMLTFPLLWVGGLVTTYDAGMSVPDWPNTYGYNLLLYPWQTWFFGPWDLFIEHGHRLLAMAVGLVTIGLVVQVYFRESRRWVFWLALAALAAVILQGALGGFRVVLSETLLAKIHGCFGPLFFSMTVALAAVTSRWWQNAAATIRPTRNYRLRFWSLALPLLAYAQLVLGAQLRHLPTGLTASMFRSLALFHVLVGLLVAAICLVLAYQTLRGCWGKWSLVVPALLLLLLVTLQISLGIGTWVTHYGWPAPINDSSWNAGFVLESRSWIQSHLATAHVAGGSLILGISVLLGLRVWRMTVLPQPVLPALPRAAGALI